MFYNYCTKACHSIAYLCVCVCVYSDLILRVKLKFINLCSMKKKE